MRLGKTAVFHFSSQVVVSLAGFVATFLIAYLLGAEGLGRYSVVVALGFFWFVIPASAISKSISKRMSEGTDPTEYFGGGLLLNAGIAVILSAIVLFGARVLAAPWVPDNEFTFVLTTYDVELVGLIIATTLFKTVQSGLEGRKQVAQSGGITAVERVGRTLFQTGVLVVGFGVGALTLGHAGSLALVALGALVLFELDVSRPTRHHLRSLLSYAKYAWLSALRARVFGWLDTIVLSFFVGASLIGIYEVAWGIGSLLAVASGSISKTLFPEVSDLSTTDDYDRIVHYLDEGLTFSGIVVIPGLFGAAIIGERILQFYRPEFGQGEYILVILVAAYAADVYASQFLNVVNAVDRPDVAFRINSVFIVANIVLNIVLVWQYGWYGAAVATAVSTGLRTVGGTWAVWRIAETVSIPTREIFTQVLAALVMCVFVWPVREIVPSNRFGTLILVGFGALVYFTALLSLSTRVRKKATAIASVLPEGA